MQARVNFCDRGVKETSWFLPPFCLLPFPSSSSLPFPLSPFRFAFLFPSLLASSFTQCPSHSSSLASTSSRLPRPPITVTCSAAGSSHTAVHVSYLTALPTCCAWHHWHLTNVQYDMLPSFTPKDLGAKSLMQELPLETHICNQLPMDSDPLKCNLHINFFLNRTLKATWR